MVKGITRRVVVIKSPDPRIFDEAIFIVKEDALHHGVTNEQILTEAQETAEKYIMSQRVNKKSFLSRLSPPAFAAIGAGATALIWLISNLLL
jgi:hypothetical protein